ncbi:hypothetical protein BISU_0748 [Bifidobacterium subtile]|uniref:Uncharacterized protein n=1 Tax=Bifidobacterium subtile TaxID=77635 RepID=A0A087EAD5_9BIFI|nr:hypothetical protein BISU_0748 [Bifidobacterium subtile]
MAGPLDDSEFNGHACFSAGEGHEPALLDRNNAVILAMNDVSVDVRNVR